MINIKKKFSKFIKAPFLLWLLKSQKFFLKLNKSFWMCSGIRYIHKTSIHLVYQVKVPIIQSGLCINKTIIIRKRKKGGKTIAI